MAADLQRPLRSLVLAALCGVAAVPALGALLGGGPLLVAGLGGLAACAAAALLASRMQGVLGPAEALLGCLAAQGRGEDRPAPPATAHPGVAQALAGFEGLCRALEDARGQAAERGRRAEQLCVRLHADLSEVIGEGAEQEESVEEACALLGSLNASIQRIHQEVERLSGASEEVSSSTLQMGSSIEEVSRSTGALHSSVDASTASIHQMSSSIRQVAESADAVQAVAEQSAAAMLQMDRAVHEVGEHVRGASALTQQVYEAAESGSREVRATIDGIQEIRALTGDAKSVLQRLAERIVEIGEIMDVIGAINDETHLLSLNAAIIAAQAGEHGKAFAVVANHVKTLSQRTASSTHEIEQLIHAVQQESGNAVEAMDAGIHAVESGVDRSQRAGEVLERIRSSAEEASARVAEISRAASEQGRNSRHVAQAAQQTSERIQQISQAMAEQSRASRELLRNAEEALETCRQVHRSTEEQRESSRFIAASLGSIRERIESIQESAEAHSLASQALSTAVERMSTAARKASARIPEALRAVESLRPQGS